MTTDLLPAESTEQQNVPDVTVIIATHQGAARIERALASLARQTLDSNRFETVIVVNGDDDETAPKVRGWVGRTGHPRVRVLRTATAGASHARNLGLGAARGTYCTFLDDDDWLSPTFLEDLLTLAGPGVVAVGRMNDVVGDVDSEPRVRNYFNDEVVKWAGETVEFARVPTAAAANATKLVETARAAEVLFDTTLRSGEDVVFWADLFTRRSPALRFASVDLHAVYYRWTRNDSISRRQASYGFNVEERLDVIERLLRMARERPQHARPLESMARAQAAQINTYLKSRPNERHRVLASVRDRNIVDFPYGSINRGLAKELVIAYAFPPTNDTSGIVVARRIAQRGEPVDVVSSSLRRLRTSDPSTLLIADEHVARRVVIDEPATFGNWRLIEGFCRNALNRIRALGTEYERIYSRSMWPAAHILAALYKAENPEVHWRAEFSDPILFDSRGERRHSSITEGDMLDRLRAALRAAEVEAPDSDNLFEWIERLVYGLADELLFTNSNQLEYMLGYLGDRRIERTIRARATIESHPTLPRDFYAKVPSSFEFDPTKVNIGYFGVFYKVRGVGDILEAMSSLAVTDRNTFAVHIFTDKPEATAETVESYGLSDVVHVRPYVSYLEFLNLTTKLDWLLVCDARTAASHGINPYLPSKVSDYRGSGTPIWAIVEEGSILSNSTVHAKSVLGDVEGAARVLGSMLALHQRA